MAWLRRSTCMALLLLGSVSPSSAADTTRLENALVEAVDADYSSVAVRDCPNVKPPGKVACSGSILQLKVSDAGLRAKLKLFRPGDHIRIDAQNGELKDLPGAWFITVDPLTRVVIFAVSAMLLFGIATALTRGSPQKLIVGQDNRYSNSKFQMALWFWMLLSSYLALFALRISSAGLDFVGGINIPQNLLLLSGLSAVTYAGAKAITTAKVEAAANPVAAPGAVVQPVSNPNAKPIAPEGAEKCSDLVQNDFGKFDFGDFQMLIVTLIAVGTFLVLVFHCLEKVEFVKTITLPDLDTTLLASFGLGQGAYLTKKAAGDVGKS